MTPLPAAIAPAMCSQPSASKRGSTETRARRAAAGTARASSGRTTRTCSTPPAAAHGPRSGPSVARCRLRATRRRRSPSIGARPRATPSAIGVPTRSGIALASAAAPRYARYAARSATAGRAVSVEVRAGYVAPRGPGAVLRGAHPAGAARATGPASAHGRRRRRIRFARWRASNRRGRAGRSEAWRQTFTNRCTAVIEVRTIITQSTGTRMWKKRPMPSSTMRSARSMSPPLPS